MNLDPFIEPTSFRIMGSPSDRTVPAERIPGAEMASLAGMGLGWLVMNSLLFMVILASAIIDGGMSGGDMAGIGGFSGVFAVCSVIVCFAAWLLIAWPVTRWRWNAMVLGEASWQVHGVFGAVGGLACGGIVTLMSGSPEVGAVFGGLALVAGAVCGTWAGWKARQKGIRMRMERGELS